MPVLRESFQVAATPEEVLARIKARASLWKESLVPAELARRGVTGVEVFAERESFELRVHPSHRDPPPTEYRFLGSVRALESGSVVDVEVGVLPFSRFSKTAWAFLAVAVSLAWYLLGSFALVLLAVVGVIYWTRDWMLVRGVDPVVEFYFDLLRRALEPDTEPRAG